MESSAVLCRLRRTSAAQGCAPIHGRLPARRASSGDGMTGVHAARTHQHGRGLSPPQYRVRVCLGGGAWPWWHCHFWAENHLRAATGVLGVHSCSLSPLHACDPCRGEVGTVHGCRALSVCVAPHDVGWGFRVLVCRHLAWGRSCTAVLAA